MKTIASWIDTVLMSGGDAAIIEKTRAKVQDLCKQFPVPNYNL
jgi:glycine/serine hydroxymethyltransferase